MSVVRGVTRRRRRARSCADAGSHRRRRPARTALAVAVVALVAAASLPQVAAGKARKDDQWVAAERTFFFRRAACGATDKLRLSIRDGRDAACADMQGGIHGDVTQQAGLSETWVSYPAADGIPFVLSIAKPLRGEITVYGPACAQEPACLPQGGAAAGNATLRLVVLAKPPRGKELRIGEFQESFVISPAEPIHTSSFKIWPDEWFHRNRFVGLRVEVQVGGASYGPTGLSYDDPASFITVPALRR